LLLTGVSAIVALANVGQSFLAAAGFFVLSLSCFISCFIWGIIVVDKGLFERGLRRRIGRSPRSSCCISSLVAPNRGRYSTSPFSRCPRLAGTGTGPAQPAGCAAARWIVSTCVG